MIRAGDMRHQVVVERLSTTQDASGQAVNAWNHIVTRRAALQRTAGDEVFTAATRNARVPTIFRLRYCVEIQPKDRLRHGGKVYNIKSAIDPDGRLEELVVTTEELVEEIP